MLHSCFTPIAFYFVYTSWHFYAFSGTNILTRCHSASSYFLLFLCFRKVTQEIFSELDETKPEVPIFPNMKMESKAEMEEGQEAATPPGGTPPSGRTRVWYGSPGHPLTSPFRLQNPSDVKILNQPASIHEKFCSVATIKDEVWGTEVSVLAPCRDGELPPEPSPSTPPPSPSMLLSPMMRRV
jgi:hypothetical protein